MIIYPAIDLKNEKCVRLCQGKEEDITIYHQNPKVVAEMWQREGAKALHIVDLDGAFKGSSWNGDIIGEMVRKVNIPIQVGGGIRSLTTLEKWLAIGVQRVILGTMAIEDQDFLKEALKIYDKKIVVSIDAKDGYVATDGWVKTSNIKTLEFVEFLESIGASTIIYTDISRDGMLQGPNLQGIRNLKKSTKLQVIASGGVASISDLLKLKEIGVEGVIVGKALYEGKVNLREAEVALR